MENIFFLKHLGKFIIKDCHDILFLAISDIFYIKSDENFIEIFTTSSSYQINCTLKKVETKLPDFFIRTHKSYIVNCNYISKIIRGTNKNFSICLLNEQKIPLTKLAKQNLFKYY